MLLMYIVYPNFSPTSYIKGIFHFVSTIDKFLIVVILLSLRFRQCSYQKV